MAPVALPEVTLTCRSCDHQFPTRARGGQSVKCPKCTVSVWVPTHRPTGEAPAAAAGELAQRWATERTAPAPEPDSSRNETEPDGQPCPNCGSVTVWESGRTLLICPKCNSSSLPA